VLLARDPADPRLWASYHKVGNTKGCHHMSVFFVCPRCGVKNNYRRASANTVQRCRNRGQKVLLPSAPGFGTLSSAPGFGTLLGGGFATFLLLFCCLGSCVLVTGLGRNPDGHDQTSLAQTGATQPTNTSPTRPTANADEEARRLAAAKAEDDHKAYTQEPGTSNGLSAQKALEEQARKAQEEAERLEEQMARYTVAALEYHADSMLRIAQGFEEDYREARRRGDLKGMGRAEAILHRRLEAIVTDYAETQAGKDAQALLDHETVPDRPKPVLPTLPVEVAKVEPHPLFGTLPSTSDQGASKPATPASPPAAVVTLPARSDPAKTVFVQGYHRKDGTYVRPHYRRPPSR
jgi:hypothetical protein